MLNILIHINEESKTVAKKKKKEEKNRTAAFNSHVHAVKQ